MHSIPGRRIILVLFLIFLLLPIYWLVNMSFKTNAEIVSTMNLWPHTPTLQHYRRIFTDESWYSGSYAAGPGSHSSHQGSFQ